jgi:Ca-activated chloride channel family protein
MSRKTGIAAGVAAGFWIFTQVANGGQVPADVPVPGGVKALAAISRIDTDAPNGGLLGEYCRALIHYLTTDAGISSSEYAAGLREYFAAVRELEKIAEPRGGKTVVSLSLGENAKRTARVLELFGWKVMRTRGRQELEPGEDKLDGARQRIPAALGIDAVSMQQALERGETFRFELESGRARLNGDWWREYVERSRRLPGGFFEALAGNVRLAKAYLALGAAQPETAAALLKGMGLPGLVERNANELALYGGSFQVRNGAAVVPGGDAAEPLWAGLAGASPLDAPAFFRKLLDKDRGLLAAFYDAIAQSDAAHQRFFTSSRETLKRYYEWYRDSDEFPNGALHPARTWRARMFRELPLDRQWPASDALEAPVAIVELERERKAPLDARSARLIEEHFDAWRPLVSYFAALPALGAAEFESLAAFEQALQGYEARKRSAALGYWYSLVELITLAGRAGSLDARASAGAFRRACEAGRRPDLSAAAVEVLKSIGAGSVEGVENLLRLSGGKRAAFERILSLQQVPPLADDDEALAAVSGLVYAAHLDPDALLVADDPTLVRRHRFVDPRRPGLFLPARLEVSSEAPGSRFTGGFANFDAAARKLAPARGGTRWNPRTDEPMPDPEPEPAGGTFHAQARLVEVYATVTDKRGRTIDGLAASDFTLLDNGAQQAIAAFEPQLSSVSCALVLDVTESMEASLASVRKAAFDLIDALRPSDSVAVFAFNQAVTTLQPFTRDKAAAKRAVLGAEIGGVTALYDALVRVSRAMSSRSGKKVIVVLTDGSDNSSVLSAEAAIRRAKNTGAAIYTIAEGAALDDKGLVKSLADIADSTGGLPFAASDPRRLREAAETIAADFTHGYLLAFRPIAGGTDGWHSIQLLLRGEKRYKVRARAGYYPE